MTRKEKLLDISMLLGTAVAVLVAMFAGFAKETDKLYESTFRLHILANSDSPEDQRMKYELRDYILTDLGAVFSSCPTKEATVALAERNIPYIEQRSNEFLMTHGYDCTVKCSVENTEFPTRVYGEMTLPAGNYDALRVVIGDGAGKNWWCVLFPSVCIKAASVQTGPILTRALYEQRKAADRMTADSLRAERGGVEYRFALYDFIKSLFGI